MSLDTSPARLLGRLLYSPAETEVILGISHATVYRLIRVGRLDAKRSAARP